MLIIFNERIVYNNIILQVINRIFVLSISAHRTTTDIRYTYSQYSNMCVYLSYIIIIL